MVVRFSSIGDIVLTTPIVRTLKTQLKDVEVHYLTKANYRGILDYNPFIDKVFTIDKSIDEVKSELNKESYDFIVDLHNNIRTRHLKWLLKKPSKSFPKLNLNKFLLTKLKINKMPRIHLVDRYFETVKGLGVKNDFRGLDYFIPKADRVNLMDWNLPTDYLVYAIGAKFDTKRLPKEQIKNVVGKIKGNVVLLGGEIDVKMGEVIAKEYDHVTSLCGKLNLNQSASVIEQSKKVISHDTGLMHIAAAFKKPIVSIWGNTVPEFGFYPYLLEDAGHFSIHQVEDLKCRPCSKIGYQACPKGHFNCMNMQDIDGIVEEANAEV